MALRRLGPAFDGVLFSPRIRARQTAELAAEAWSARQRSRLEAYEPLAGGFDAAQALEAIREAPGDGRLLVVGHEPDMSRVVGELTGARADVKKGGVAVVRLEGAGGELVALLRPRELALIASVPVGGK